MVPEQIIIEKFNTLESVISEVLCILFKLI